MILTGKEFPLGIWMGINQKEEVNTCCVSRHEDNGEEIVVFQPHNSASSGMIAHFPIGRFQALFQLKQSIDIPGFEKDTMLSGDGSEFVGLWKNKTDETAVNVCCISMSAKFEDIGRRIVVFQPHNKCCAHHLHHLPVDVFSMRYKLIEKRLPVPFFEYPPSNCRCR